MIRGVTNTYSKRLITVPPHTINMVEQYLLTLEERAGDNGFITRHLIEATDRQMVKYHYHRTMKDWAYTDAEYGGKHCLESWDLGLNAEIEEIRKIDKAEYNILEKYLPTWAKV